MWKYQPFWDLVENILKVDVVSEFFIIDNDTANKPDLEVLKHPKVKIVSFGKNIYCNPAWNCGALDSNSELLCFLSDDCIFDIKLLYKISTFLTKEMGCVCLSEQKVENGLVQVKKGKIEFTPFTGQSIWGYGVLFFMHKDNWIDIPPNILLAYGDNFMFDQCHYRGLQNYMIDDLFHYHAGAITSSVVGDSGKNLEVNFNKETEEYNKIFPRIVDKSFNFNFKNE